MPLILERNGERSLDFMKNLFKCYIKDTLGVLTREKQEVLEGLKLCETFNMPGSNWKEVVTNVLKLSETIDIAIWNSWISSEKKMYVYSVDEFAKDFILNYYKEGAKVDLWQSAEQLEMAKQKIEEYKNKQFQDIHRLP